MRLEERVGDAQPLGAFANDAQLLETGMLIEPIEPARCLRRPRPPQKAAPGYPVRSAWRTRRSSACCLISCSLIFPVPEPTRLFIGRPSGLLHTALPVERSRHFLHQSFIGCVRCDVPPLWRPCPGWYPVALHRYRATGARWSAQDGIPSDLHQRHQRQGHAESGLDRGDQFHAHQRIHAQFIERAAIVDTLWRHVQNLADFLLQCLTEQDSQFVIISSSSQRCSCSKPSPSAPASSAL